jgi:uncharacterized membrane protein
MGPADRSERPQDAARRHQRVRIDAETIGIGALLAAVGICCITTLAATGLGAVAILTVAGHLAGLVWLIPLLAIVGIVGIVWLRARRRRGEIATSSPTHVR